MSILYVLVFAFTGILLNEVLLPNNKIHERIWLGLTFGLLLLIWLPALVSFIIGFTLVSQIIALVFSIVIAILCFFKVKDKKIDFKEIINVNIYSYLVLMGIFLLGGYLFYTHILLPSVDGYMVGQTTYGDLSMHLGFITSIAKQGVFPPNYNIHVGHQVNYPFLCETPASTLLLLGSSLRDSYLITALYAYGLVITGVYFFFKQWIKKVGVTLISVLLFFFGSGFGFIYFIDLINPLFNSLDKLLGSNSIGNNLTNLLDGYYVTPTNLPQLGLRWVNPIVDLLIPQRATLFGWAFLFACLYLLMGIVFYGKKENVKPLILIAGGLPLIHTHSFLGLGIISFGYLVLSFIRKEKEIEKQLIVYGIGTVLLALPQLIGFTFVQATESSLVRFHFNWANTNDTYLWFYVKNMGWIYILGIVSLIKSKKIDRYIMVGPILLWVISEFIVFQPNVYDNNKLLFISFAFICGLVSKMIYDIYIYLDKKINLNIEETSTILSKYSMVILVGLILYFIINLIININNVVITLEFRYVFIILIFLSLILWLLINTIQNNRKDKGLYIAILSNLIVILIFGKLLLDQYKNSYIAFDTNHMILFIISLTIILYINFRIINNINTYITISRYIKQIILISSIFVLIVTTFLSSGLTIIREIRSEYLAFDIEEIEVAKFIDKNIEKDAIFLTDYNWHFNSVAVLSGRNIVTGSDIYLYFHGVDTSERKKEVISMYEDPRNNLDLFDKYNARYVFIGKNERNYFKIDEKYFKDNFKVIYDTGSVIIYRVN